MAVVTGRAAAKAFRKPIEVYTCWVTLAETVKYLPGFCERYDASVEVAMRQLAALPIEALGPPEYDSKLAEARKLIGKRDPDDVDLLALALAKGLPVWTNDKDFDGLPVKTFTTAQFLKHLGI